MSVANEQQMRGEAERLYLRGLHVSARCADRTDREDLKTVVEVWQKAWEMYREIGDTKRADDVQQLLVGFYKREYAKAHKDKEQGLREGVLEKFREWSMFFKIGCFGFGGPMAVFSLLEDELVRNKKILTNKDFLEGAVLGDILPGPITMDIVTYTGYKLKKWSGALIATLAFILPSFLIMLVLAMLYEKYSLTPAIEGILACLGAAVTGLIISVGLNLSKAEIKDYREACILIGSFTASLVFKLDIVVTVGLAGLIGIIVYNNDPETLAETLQNEP